ncbi:MAG: class IV adenylate cyclase [Oscillospiraceae bacterium]|nr:class IV adenylate cyclase [Oscillospiraceae bacterium]
MREVEIKAVCPGAALAALESWLLERGFVPGAAYRQEDDYYNHPARNFLHTDEAVRLRRVLSGGQDKTVFTYKGPNHSDRGQSREELETGVENAIVMRAALERLGFRAVASVYKSRREFKKADITVCLDDVEGLGSFFEIEILCRDGREAEAEGRLAALMEELRFASPVEEPRTYLELLRKGAGRG